MEVLKLRQKEPAKLRQCVKQTKEDIIAGRDES